MAGLFAARPQRNALAGQVASIFGATAPRNALISSADVMRAKPRPTTNALAPKGTGMFAGKRRPEMTAYNPSWAEKAQQKLSDLLSGMGMDRRAANQTSSNLTAFLNDWTPVGNVMGVADADNDLERQLSMLPLPGPARQAVGQALKGIRAFHGSPHDFDRFDISKIGTGEGAQAYGHGLYFAENEKVADEYRKQLAGDGFLTGRGEVFDPYRELQHPNIRAPLARTGDLDASLARARELLPSANDQTRPMLQSDLARLEQLQAIGGIRPNSGRMYEVNINADPNSLLDWDAPLAQQPGAVRRVDGGELYRDSVSPYENTTGFGLYRALTADLGSPQVASEAMRAAGIPGLKYLDQGSRGAANGTRNFVVFDDKLVDIRRKY